VRILGKLAVVVAVLASTYYAILRVAGHKADALAGGGTFRLDRSHPEDEEAFAALLGQLRSWGQADLADSLRSLQEEGRLFVAPRLAGERSAIYVDSLGLARRIYVRPDELVARKLPFPDLDAPEDAQRTFTRIRLAGTLFHELQHYGGLEDEAATYDRAPRVGGSLSTQRSGEPASPAGCVCPVRPSASSRRPSSTNQTR
jgi:hypothetical protein